MNEAKDLLLYAIKANQEHLANAERLSYDLDREEIAAKIRQYEEAINLIENWEIFNEYLD